MSRHQPATITNLSRPDQQSRIPVRQARESGQLTTVQGCSSSETTTSVSSSAVPKASLLASPTGSVTIEDGQFNAIGRDHISVTVINGCPYDENMNALGRQRKAKKTISVNNKNVQTVQDTEKEETEHLKDLSEGDINGYKWSPRAPRHCAIYVRNLLLEGYGWPFYVPGPNMSLPEAYRNRMGMQNGDVGIINILGYFEFFFNICHPADHPINYQGVPKNFKQLQIELTDIQKHFDLNGENFISSSSITNSSSLKFESLASEGAILAMPDGAISEDVRNEAMFKKYVSIHVEDWYRFIRNIRGRNVKNGDIRLVIGYHKTSRWCMVTFSNSMALQANRNPFLLELIPVTETNVYDWKQSGTAATVVKTGPGTQELEDLRKTDPGGEQTIYQNQSLFMRSISGIVKENTWDKLVAESDEIEIDDDTSRGDAFHTGSSGQSSTGSRPSNSSTTSSTSTSPNAPNKYNALASIHQGSVMPDHPSDVINRMLLKLSPNVRVAITSDNDWISVLHKNDIVFPSNDELCSRIKASLAIHQDENAIFLERPDLATSSPCIDNNTKEGSVTIAPPSTVTLVQLATARATIGRGLERGIGIQRFGQVFDVESAIGMLSKEVASTPLNPDRPGRLNDLAISYHSRFERFGKVMDIDSAIDRQLESVASTPFDSTDRPIRLNNLGIFYQSRFERFGEVEDIDSAIERHLEAVASTPLNSTDRPIRLNNLGNSHIGRFELFREVKDIDLAIEKHREAAASTPLDSPHRPAFLNNLGISHMYRFKWRGEVKDLDSAIQRQLEAVASTPLDCVDLPGFLINLASLYLTRFEWFGQEKDIDLATERHREAVSFTPIDSAELPGFFNNLGLSDWSCFERFGEAKDIDWAIERKLEAVAFTPLNSPFRPALLNNLGNSLICRFQRFGDVKDIDSAIEQQLEAVVSTPPSSADRPGLLNNLGTSYRSRFEQFGVAKDIDSAIDRHREAVASTPLYSADRPTILNNLGNSLICRFQRFGEIKDVDSAIERGLEAVALTQFDSAERPGRLSNLAVSYHSRFKQFGDLKDIDSAIKLQLEAVVSTPLNNPSLSGRLNGLATSYQSRFKQFGEMKDIDMAIERQLEAVSFTPINSARRPAILNNLGNLYICRFESIQEVTDWQNAISKFRLSSISQNGLPNLRIRASLQWAHLTCRLHNLGSASKAYDQAIRLLPQVAWIGFSPVTQLNNLNSDIQTLGCDAAACLIALAQAEPGNMQHHLGRAIELLDQGRSILWSQTSNFKQELKDLQEVSPQLASELDLVGKALGQACFSVPNDTISEADALVYRRSAVKWEELVNHIRTNPSFNNFLLPSPISTLQTAAADGPVVIINSSQYRCDALIIPPQGDLVLLALPNITPGAIKKLTSQHKQEDLPLGFTSKFKNMLDGDSDEPTTLESVLNHAWLLIGEPVVLKLKELGLLRLGIPKTCRVWWCLTGPLSFLPIHASFPPNEPTMGMMDNVISSYTPTISALLRVQRSRKLSTFRMLVVGHSGMMPLPGATEEIAFISKKLGVDAQTLEGCEATVDKVAASLPTCPWFHFAGHGVHDHDNPMDSGLVLWNGHRLTLSRLAQNLPASAEFAFLSACLKLKGFQNEAVHLAAGLQFIGYRGVIGTLWEVRDNDALSVAMQVYEELFKDGIAQASPSDAALALHQAVCHLRDREVSLVRWVPFVHFGL